MAMLASGGLEEIWKRHRSELEGRIRGKIEDSAIGVSSYSTNAGNFEITPVAVVTPENADDVVEVVNFCRKYGIAVTARGSGTSVTDAAIGPGIVLDFSRSMNSILALDVKNGLVTVGAGITIESLNTELRKYGMMLPLFPVNGLLPTVGGCLATDAGGFLAAEYGRMHGIVVSIEAVDARGERFELKRDLPGMQRADMEIVRAKLAPLLKDNVSHRGTCGYRLPSVMGETPDYVDLMAGSEGSLAIFTSITVSIVQRIDSLQSTLTVFRSLGDACSFARSAGGSLVCAEFLDSAALNAFRSVFSLPSLPREAKAGLVAIWKERAAPPAVMKNCGAQLSIDLAGEPFAVLAQLSNALHRLQRPSDSGRYVVAAEGIEVAPGNITELIDELDRLSRRYALNLLTFGHATEGIVYIRPFLDLRKADDRHKLPRFLTELSSYLKESGGALSSENGLGIQLRPYLQGAVEEDTLAAFELLKKTFDPMHILGGPRSLEPGGPMPYRFGPEHDRRPFRPLLNWNTRDVISRFDAQPLSMIEEIDACHGCGECRTLSFIETQCPVYRTMGSELTSPRGMDNLVRLLSNIGGVPTVAMYSNEYMRSIYDYCIECKMCASECPSHVNTPKIIMEARAQHVKRVGPGTISRASRFFSDYELYTMIASSVARLSNRLIRSRNARSALEHSLGIDRRRKIPEFDTEPFGEWFEKRVAKPGIKGEVAYFADIYANYFDSRVGRAVVGLLEKIGYTTLFPRQHFTGLPLIYLGMLREANKYILENISSLYPYSARSIPVLCSSPSAVMAFRNDYLSVVDDERSRALSRTAVDVHEFLHGLLKTGGLGIELKPVAGRILYHPSCHSRALGTDLMVAELLRQIPGAQVEVLQAGCCGAGGSYGFAKETFSLSMEIGRNVFLEAGKAASQNVLLVTDGEECALQIEQATGRAPEMTLLLLARAAGIGLPKTEGMRRRK